MISKEMEKALNDQINAEFFSAYLYLAMAAYFEDENLSGCAHWMELQYQEESEHGMKIYKYINDRGGRVQLNAIEKPQEKWENPLAAFEAAYKHEQYITGRINDLMKLAVELNDFTTQSFLQWYLNEQIEEEANVDGIVQSFNLMGNDKRALFMMDRELKQRQLSSDTGK
ncbi:MAG: ferritin [Acidobacteria bacterium]|nr:MAG: ferritin [Acidobacteriota bacterium]RLE21401.1 MAG: ferritin [Acidobacteriota bacterium]